MRSRHAPNRWLLVLVLAMVAAPTVHGQESGAAAAPRAEMPAPVFPWFYPQATPPAAPAFPQAPQAFPVNPYTQWMGGMAVPPAAMMNPYLYHQWSAMMMNPGVDLWTRHRSLDSMMRAFDPRIFGVPGTPPAGEGEPEDVPQTVPVVRLPGFPTQTKQTWRPNTVTEGVSEDAKRAFYRSMMMASPLSMRDMIGIMAKKKLVDEVVTFDDAIEAMKLRANEVNFKLVGHNPLWLDVRAITGDENTPRMEIFQFCDAMVGRKILDIVPEFAVFLPCRIALLEDADRRIWVMTLDWDVGWMDFVQNPNSVLEVGLRTEAKRIRDAIHYIMEGAVTGDF